MMYQDPQPSMTTRHRLLLVNQIGLILGILSSTYDPYRIRLIRQFWGPSPSAISGKSGPAFWIFPAIHG